MDGEAREYRPPHKLIKCSLYLNLYCKNNYKSQTQLIHIRHIGMQIVYVVEDLDIIRVL